MLACGRETNLKIGKKMSIIFGYVFELINLMFIRIKGGKAYY